MNMRQARLRTQAHTNQADTQARTRTRTYTHTYTRRHTHTRRYTHTWGRRGYGRHYTRPSNGRAGGLLVFYDIHISLRFKQTPLPHPGPHVYSLFHNPHHPVPPLPPLSSACPASLAILNSVRTSWCTSTCPNWAAYSFTLHDHDTLGNASC
ncbi:hypothetical protein LZ32DRAFT_329935 [Colletotrichum eremochloae]|nr:hypothetical protein LZ32DRAFT_329935 [Colletotrichum eremochloae]